MQTPRTRRHAVLAVTGAGSVGRSAGSRNCSLASSASSGFGGFDVGDVSEFGDFGDFRRLRRLQEATSDTAAGSAVSMVMGTSSQAAGEGRRLCSGHPPHPALRPPIPARLLRASIRPVGPAARMPRARWRHRRADHQPPYLEVPRGSPHGAAVRRAARRGKPKDRGRKRVAWSEGARAVGLGQDTEETKPMHRCRAPGRVPRDHPAGPAARCRPARRRRLRAGRGRRRRPRPARRRPGGLDGYAVMSADLSGAAEGLAPVVLEVMDSVRAGETHQTRLVPGLPSSSTPGPLYRWAPMLPPSCPGPSPIAGGPGPGRAVMGAGDNVRRRAD